MRKGAPGWMTLLFSPTNGSGITGYVGGGLGVLIRVTKDPIFRLFPFSNNIKKA